MVSSEAEGSSAGTGSGAGSWRVHRFVVRAGGAALRVELVCCGAQVAIWAGAAGQAPSLGAGVLAMPGGAVAALEPSAEAAAAGEALAARLAARLRCPVWLLAPELDRLAAPLLEAALCSEVKARPDLFPGAHLKDKHEKL